MIPVTATISLSEAELDFEFVRASGPGGQKVNKVATAVQLRFDAQRSPSLPDDTRRRLIKLAGSRVTTGGVVVIDARRFRSQEQNRRDAVERLVALIRRADVKPKPRRKTRPSAAMVRRRLSRKRKRSELKRSRRSVGPHGND